MRTIRKQIRRFCLVGAFLATGFCTLTAYAAENKTGEELSGIPQDLEYTEYQADMSQQQWEGSKLTKSKGVNNGPQGKETYYNLNMSRIISIMRNMGYSEEEYPYWIREDGCKMLGNYIMVAANQRVFPRGTILQTSLGMAMVCDSCGAAQSNKTLIDIAVDW